jgi:hypothetical protein
MRPKEGLEAAVREPEEVLGTDAVSSELVEGEARFAQALLAVRNVLRRAWSRATGFMRHALDVAVSRRDQHDAHRARLREDALDQASSRQRLIVRMWSDDQQALTGPDP